MKRGRVSWKHTWNPAISRTGIKNRREKRACEEGMKPGIIHIRSRHARFALRFRPHARRAIHRGPRPLLPAAPRKPLARDRGALQVLSISA